MKPDYSAYLDKPGMMDFIEAQWDRNPWLHDWHAQCVREAIDQMMASVLVEFGCGTGRLASRIHGVEYLMVDANPACLDRAMKRNPGKLALQADLRSMRMNRAHLGVCFGVLKHFGIEEWEDVFLRLAACCNAMVFDVPVDDDQPEMLRDDGDEFPHVWVNQAAFARFLVKHRITVREIKLDMVPTTREAVYLVTTGAGSKL